MLVNEIFIRYARVDMVAHEPSKAITKGEKIDREYEKI